MTDQDPLPMENRLNRANGAEFALRLFEINGQSDVNAGPEKFREEISRAAFSIIAFLETDLDTSERTRAVDIALRIAETYNRNFPRKRQALSDRDLFSLAHSVINFMRHSGEIIR